MRLFPYFLLTLVACGVAPPSQTPVSEPSPEVARLEPPVEAALQAPPEEPAIPPAVPRRKPEIVLSPLRPEEKLGEDETGRRRIGVHRELPELPPPSLAWTVTDQGMPVWRTTVRTSGAVALRLHFAAFHLSGGRVVIQEAAENLRADGRTYTGDGPAGDGEFWSDLIEGDSAIVEYYPGTPGEKDGPVPFQIDRASHMWLSPLDAF